MHITVSTVTPVYQGELCIEKLADELLILREQWEDASAPMRLAESIFVDDGSVDGSYDVLVALSKKYNWVRVVQLSRNFGQHAATCAGICHSSSDWVVTLDEDLQHRPKDIDYLFRKQALEGSDIVYANPEGQAHGHSWRDKSSGLVKRLLAKLTDTPQIRMFNSFRLVRGSVARAAASSSSSQTYLDIAISWFSKSCSSISLKMRDDRFLEGNKSGYSFGKLVSHARRLIVSSQVDVAMTGVTAGFLAILIAIIIGAFSLFQRIFAPETIGLQGWASIIALQTFFGGMIIALLCIVIEYININVVNQLGKPTFFTIDRSSDYLIEEWFSSR